MINRNNLTNPHFNWIDRLQIIKNYFHCLLSGIHTNYCEVEPITYVKGMVSFNTHFILVGPISIHDKNRLWDNANKLHDFRNFEIIIPRIAVTCQRFFY